MMQKEMQINTFMDTRPLIGEMSRLMETWFGIITWLRKAACSWGVISPVSWFMSFYIRWGTRTYM